MSESGDTSRDAKSASVQSESKSEPKMESDGDNDRPDQHSSLVDKEMTQKTTDSDSEEDGDDTQSNTNSNAKVDKENDIENKQRPEGVTEELTNPSLVTEQQEDIIHYNTSTITKKNTQMDNEPIIERTEVTPKTAADESDQKEDEKTEEVKDTSTDSQEQDDGNTSPITEKDIKMDNEPRKRTKEKTEEVKDTSTDTQEQDDSNTSPIAKKDIKMDNEPRRRTEEKTEDIIDPSTESQEQDDSNTMPITENDIKMDNEPSKRTEEKTEEVTNTSTDTQEQEDYNSQSNTSTIAKKDIKMDNERGERTEVTPKTAADESDQKEDWMTKKDIVTSKDSQQQDDSSQFNTSAATKKGIKNESEPSKRTEDVATPKTVIGASDQKEDGMTKKYIETSKDSQQQKHSSQSNTSTITKKDIKMDNEPGERTEDEVTPKTAAGESVQKEDGMTKEDIDASKDSQQQDDSSQSDTSTTTKKDIKMDNEPGERTEDVVTTKTTAGPSSMEEKDIRWWILPVVAIIFAVCVALYNSDSTPPVQKENNVVELFTEKLNKVESSFPNQRPELWRRSRLHISRHLKTASPTEPVSLILTSGHGAERTLGCLAKRLAEAFSTAQNSSVLNINGKSKSLQDSDQVKLDIDNDLREAFDGEKLAAVIHRFEELPPGSTLIFYRYCDHENAAYKKVLLVFTVMLNAELEITDNISLGSVEDMVHDQLKRKFVSSDKSALFNQMDVDKLSGLWSRISHLILPVAAEEESIQQGCGLESF